MAKEPPIGLTAEQVRTLLEARGMEVEDDDLHALLPLVRDVREQAVTLMRVATESRSQEGSSR